jgi:hypothetical protein
VSQETAFQVLGLPPRKFLDEVAPLCPDDVIRVGRTVLLPIDVAEAALRTLAGNSSAIVDAQRDRDEGQPTSVDDVLASVGAKRRVTR